jgi:hypothetical protein
MDIYLKVKDEYIAQYAVLITVVKIFKLRTAKTR